MGAAGDACSYFPLTFILFIDFGANVNKFPPDRKLDQPISLLDEEGCTMLFLDLEGSCSSCCLSSFRLKVQLQNKVLVSRVEGFCQWYLCNNSFGEVKLLKLVMFKELLSPWLKYVRLNCTVSRRSNKNYGLLCQ